MQKIIFRNLNNVDINNPNDTKSNNQLSRFILFAINIQNSNRFPSDIYGI